MPRVARGVNGLGTRRPAVSPAAPDFYLTARPRPLYIFSGRRKVSARFRPAAHVQTAGGASASHL